MSSLTSFTCAIIFYWMLAVVVFSPYGQFDWDVYIVFYSIFIGIPLVLGTWLFRTFIARHYLYRLTSDLTDILVELTRLQWLCCAEVATSRRARRYYLRIEKSKHRLQNSIGYYGSAFSRLRGMAVDDTESSAWYFSRWISWVSQDCLDSYRLSEASKAASALLVHTTRTRPYLPPPLSEPPRDALLIKVPRWQLISRLVGAVASPLGLGLIALAAAVTTATAKLM